MRRRTVAALVLAFAFALSPGHASVARADAGASAIAGGRRAPGPCAGCLAWIPAGDAPAPLLVLLHGDSETASSMLDVWGPAAGARGVAVLALACPAAEGCARRSWWKWNGAPSWLLAQVTAFAQVRAIDRERLWIAGWSGGATYIGWNTQQLEETFAAIVLHGGGAAPARSTCADPAASVYFLGGARNPLHDLAEGLHGYYAACPRDDLTWVVIPGADHEGERRALASRREAILDWLSSKRRALVHVAATAAVDASSEAAPDPRPVAAVEPSAPVHAPPPVVSSCRCATGRTSADPFAPACACALGIAAVARRRARRPERAQGDRT